MADYVQNHFYDEKSEMYFFTSSEDAALVARNIESSDNVIPASNSIMAKNLYLLSHYFSNVEYLKRAQKMLHNISPNFNDYPSAYSNWMDLQLNFVYDFYEVVATGPEANQKLEEMQQVYYPNKLVAGAKTAFENALFKGRLKGEETNIFICVDNACRHPVKTSKEAFEILQED